MFVKGIILAAGRGSRMGKLTKDHPKCLTYVRGKLLIDHQIQAFMEAGIKEICLVTGYKSECLKEFGSHQFYNERWSETNMVRSLLCAQEWLDGADCIVSYSDIYFDPRIVKELMLCEENISIAYDPNWLELWSKRFNAPLEDAETFRIDDLNYLLEIGQKSSSIEEIQGQYMGLLKFKKGYLKKCFKKVPNIDINKIDMTSFLRSLIFYKIRIKAVPNKYFWAECDTEHDVMVANEADF